MRHRNSFVFIDKFHKTQAVLIGIPFYIRMDRMVDLKKIIAILAVITLCLTGYTLRYAEDTIVICSSSEQFRNDYVQEDLRRQFPQYNIVVMYMPTGKAAAKVAVEKKKTDIDILMGLETGYLSKIQDELTDVRGRSRLDYLPGLSPEEQGGKWVIWERFAGAIVVNRDVLGKYGLPAPQTYEELLDPRYRNLIAMPDPKSSGTGYFFYQNWVNLWGEEKTLEYVDRLHENLKQFTESGSGPIKMMIQGETAIGLGMTFQAVSEINNSVPLEIIYPPEGSPYSLTGNAIVAGKEKKSGVNECFDYLIHQSMVYDKENFSPEAVLTEQNNNVPNYPQNIQYADMSGIDDADEKERLLNLWKY